MMARHHTHDPVRDDAGPTGAATHRRWDHRPEGRVRRPVANSLTVVGTLLIVLGTWSILRTVGVVPDAVADVVGDWRGAALVLGGGWMVQRGRRVTGTLVVLIGTLNLIVSLLPGQLVGPTLLIGAGVVLLIGAMGGRRWFAGRPGDAFFEEVRGGWFADRPARSIVAVFDDTTGAIGAIDASSGDRGVVECVAVFGNVTVSVPHDVAIELRQTAVFGDVRAPEPPSVTPMASVQVRATSVFGDVRLVRD